MALRADLTDLADFAAINAVLGHRGIESRRWRDDKNRPPAPLSLSIGRLEADHGCAVFLKPTIGLHSTVLQNVLRAIH